MRPIFLAAFITLFATSVFACQYDTDCAVGSKCVKAEYQINGICAGGLKPGNDNDRKPVQDMMNRSSKTGNTCSYDTQCGIGGKCYKESYSIKGVCGPA